ncbi:hypothetical protein [Sodalis sp. C49]
MSTNSTTSALIFSHPLHCATSYLFIRLVTGYFQVLLNAVTLL